MSVIRFRDRRHAEAVAEIKETALRLYADGGADKLALRAVAREMGMSPQALYHYFASKDALLTALIDDGFTAAAAAIAEGRDTGGDDPRERLRGAALAYRRWAVAHPHVYRLLYADVITKPRPGGTGLRPGIELAQACFAGWTPRRYAALDRALGGDGTVPDDQDGRDITGFATLPESVRMLLARWWGQLHGLMSLEILGHLRWTALEPARIYESTVDDLADHILEVIHRPDRE